MSDEGYQTWKLTAMDLSHDVRCDMWDMAVRLSAADTHKLRSLGGYLHCGSCHASSPRVLRDPGVSSDEDEP